MSKLLKFLKGINIPEDVLSSLTSDEELDNEVLQNQIDTYNNSRSKYYENHFLETKKRGIMDETLNGYTLKVKKDLNKKFNLGLSNTILESEDFKQIDKFYDALKKAVDDNTESLTSNADATLKADLSKWQQKASEATIEADKYRTEIDQVKASAETRIQSEIQSLKSQIYLSNLISSDTKIANVPGREYALEKIREDITKNCIIDDNGKIKRVDGSAVTHPEKSIIIEDAVDLYEFYKSKAGLVQQSNGGQTGQGGQSQINKYVDSSGRTTTTTTSDAARIKMEELAKKRMGQ
jgi:hypothetical protein